MTQRIPGLDGLRAFAVLAVLLFHAAPGGPFPGGFLGVDLFFVLSGFLITGVLVADDRLGSFYWKRFCRLGPALGLFLLAYVLVAPAIWPGHSHGRDALLAGLYVSNWTFTFWGDPEYIRHTWSLAVEEQFYLIWPFALPLLLKSRQPARWLFAAVVLLTLWRCSFAANWMSYYYRTDTRLTGLLVGAALYFVRDRLVLSRTAFWIGAALSGWLLLAADILRAFLFIPLAELAAVLMIGAAVSGNAPHFLDRPLLVRLGLWSYGIYLWHNPATLALRDQGFWVALAGSLAVAIPCAALSYYSVEAAGRRLKNMTAAELRSRLRRFTATRVTRPS